MRLHELNHASLTHPGESRLSRASRTIRHGKNPGGTSDQHSHTEKSQMV